MTRAARRRAVILTIASVGIVLLGAAVFARLSPSIRYGRYEPPAPALDDLEPGVAKLIGQATEQVRADPYSAEAWGALGASYDVHDLTANAIRCYARAETLDPGDHRWPYFLGFCHEGRDDRAALDAWTRAEALMPDSAVLQVRLGRVHLVLDDPEAATGRFERALQYDGTLIPAHVGLARVAVARGDAAGALEHLERAAALGPQSGQVDLLRAQAYQLAGQPEASARHAALARGKAPVEVMSDPTRADLGRDYGASMRWRRTRSDHYTSIGRLDEAAAEWHAALVDDPESPEAHGQLGLVYARMGRTDDAIDSFKRALELDPYEHGLRSNLGGLLISQGRTDEGIEYMRQAVRFLPDSADAHFNLGMALAAGGRQDEALESMTNACLLDANHARAQFERGKMLLARGRIDDAVVAFRQAVAAAPAQRVLRVMLANALRVGGRDAESMAVLRDAVRDFPGDGELVQLLAWRLATSPSDALLDGDAAFELIEPLCEASGFKEPDRLEVLAAACAARGDFKSAIRHAELALAIVADPGALIDPGVREQRRLTIERCLDFYRSGSRLRDASLRVP